MGTGPSCSVPLKGNEEALLSNTGVSSVHALPGQQTDIIYHDLNIVLVSAAS